MNDVIEFAGVLATLLTAGFVTWAGVIVMRRWEKQSRGASPRELAALDDRLAQLELSMETLTLEMERMTESQRFTAKLLSERAAATGEPVAEARPPARIAEPR